MIRSDETEFDSTSAKKREQRNAVHDVCREFQRAPSKGNLKKLKNFFNHCGEDVYIEQGFYCDYGSKINLGDRVYFNINCTLLDGGNITIGNDVLIGPNVQILTINHPLSPSKRLLKTNLAKDIVIEDNVWLGACSIILPGVTIEKNSVIGAGSVVTKNIDSDCLYAGNPAVKIKTLN
jgi:maltose O-acetyltransferase